MADEITTYDKVDDYTVRKTVEKTETVESVFTLDDLQFERDEWQRRKTEFDATCDAEIARLDAEITELTNAGTVSLKAAIAAQIEANRLAGSTDPEQPLP